MNLMTSKSDHLNAQPQKQSLQSSVARDGQTLTPLSPSPEGKGKPEKGFAPSYPPHPLSQGERGNRKPRSVFRKQ